VARPAAWRKQQHVNAHVIAGPAIAVSDIPGACGHAAQACFIDRGGQPGLVPPPFYLDEGHHPPSARNQVDFAARRAEPASDDHPAVEAQIPCRQGLATPPASFGLLPASDHLSASAFIF